MDPPTAQLLLTTAALMQVPVQGRFECLHELSAGAEAEIRQSSKKGDSILVAKKYLKALDALGELEKAMAVFPSGGNMRPPQKYSFVKSKFLPACKFSAACPDASLANAVVQYVPSAPLSKIGAAKRQEWGIDNTTASDLVNAICLSPIWSRYKLVWHIFTQLLWYGPLCLIVVYMCYAGFAMAHLALHPEILVKVIFRTAKSSPGFIVSHSDAVAASIWSEMVATVWGA